MNNTTELTKISDNVNAIIAAARAMLAAILKSGSLTVDDENLLKYDDLQRALDAYDAAKEQGCPE